MAELVTLGEVKAFIGIQGEPADDAVLNDLMEMVEDLLERETGQTFTRTTAVTNEPHDGTDTDVLYLDREPVTLTAAIKVGQDVAAPESTIATSDVIVDQRGRRLIYKNGARFPAGRRNIFVTYTAAANVPDLAKVAVQVATAFLYRRRGREHISGASLNELGSIDMFSARLDKLPAWHDAIAHLRLKTFA